MMSKTRAVHQVTDLQFDRAVHEYIRWMEVAEDERSPAPAWWWGPAFEARTVQQPMPARWCSGLKLPEGSSFAAGAEVFLKTFDGQTGLPWPDEFPRRPKYDAPV